MLLVTQCCWARQGKGGLLRSEGLGSQALPALLNGLTRFARLAVSFLYVQTAAHSPSQASVPPSLLVPSSMKPLTPFSPRLLLTNSDSGLSAPSLHLKQVHRVARSGTAQQRAGGGSGGDVCC